MTTEEVDYDRTTIYVPDRDEFRSEIHDLRSECEVVADAEMREIYPAIIHSALENPGDIIDYLENRGDKR